MVRGSEDAMWAGAHDHERFRSPCRVCVRSLSIRADAPYRTL